MSEIQKEIRIVERERRGRGGGTKSEGMASGKNKKGSSYGGGEGEGRELILSRHPSRKEAPTKVPGGVYLLQGRPALGGGLH